MWRAFFLALGISAVIIGAECIAVDKVYLARRSGNAPAAATGYEQAPSAPPERIEEIDVPEWAPWSFMGAGAVVILYSFTIPRRVNGG
jgi:hypothetical protein